MMKSWTKKGEPRQPGLLVHKINDLAARRIDSAGQEAAERSLFRMGISFLTSDRGLAGNRKDFPVLTLSLESCPLKIRYLIN
jgi:hypothetical protein